MATVTGVTLQRVQQIESNTIISARVENGVLYFKRGDNVTEFDVGRIVVPIIDAWPVGSIFMNTTPTNPKTLLGVPSNSPVTWVRWGKGRVPVSLDEAQTEFDVSEETGGAKTHTLTTNEMPSHRHLQTIDASYNPSGGGPSNQYAGNNTGSNSVGGGLHTEPTGGGAAHNNLQPYITVYMWKRTV